jgi:hypothetical protein
LKYCKKKYHDGAGVAWVLAGVGTVAGPIILGVNYGFGSAKGFFGTVAVGFLGGLAIGLAIHIPMCNINDRKKERDQEKCKEAYAFRMEPKRTILHNNINANKKRNVIYEQKLIDWKKQKRKIQNVKEANMQRGFSKRAIRYVGISDK